MKASGGKRKMNTILVSYNSFPSSLWLGAGKPCMTNYSHYNLFAAFVIVDLLFLITKTAITPNTNPITPAIIMIFSLLVQM